MGPGPLPGRQVLADPRPLTAGTCVPVVSSSIRLPFDSLSSCPGYVAHVLRTLSPRYRPSCPGFRARLAWVSHAASVRSEPGSNPSVDYRSVPRQTGTERPALNRLGTRSPLPGIRQHRPRPCLGAGSMERFYWRRARRGPARLPPSNRPGGRLSLKILHSGVGIITRILSGSGLRMPAGPFAWIARAGEPVIGPSRRGASSRRFTVHLSKRFARPGLIARSPAAPAGKSGKYIAEVSSVNRKPRVISIFLDSPWTGATRPSQCVQSHAASTYL